MLKAPTLTGSGVSLEPLEERHRDALRAAADDERIWRQTIVRADGATFDDWFAAATSERPKREPFAVRRLADGAYVGSTSYLDINLKHRRIEIGSTWYRPDCWGSSVNPECKLLLMRHAFEVLGMQRVAFITDVLNEHSQAAIAKLGATREGVLRAHMISQGGRQRDSVVFSVIAAEWPRVREGLEVRLAALGERPHRTTIRSS